MTSEAESPAGGRAARAGPEGGRRTTEGPLSALRPGPFRRLLATLGLSSLGDWLGLLATTALAARLGADLAGGAYAIGGVLVLRLLPAVLFGPVAGVLADRFDRRRCMVVTDLVRCVLFASIPLVGTLEWLLVASFLVELASLLWIPSKEASVPNLVPASRLESANSLSLVATYGTAPLAAVVFAASVPLSTGAGLDPAALALLANAATFAVAAAVVATLPDLGGRGANPEQTLRTSALAGTRAALSDGLAHARRTPLVRAVVVGLSGAFVAAGTIIAVGRLYARDLGAGDAGYGLLFGALFTGLAVGLGLGSRLLPSLGRHRLAGVCVTVAGACVVLVALAPGLAWAVAAVGAVGLFAGAGYVVAFTLLGLETDDAVRGRTFALVQVVTRVVLLAATAVVPFVVGALVQAGVDGVTLSLAVSGAVAVAAGLVALRLLRDAGAGAHG